MEAQLFPVLISLGIISANIVDGLGTGDLGTTTIDCYSTDNNGATYRGPVAVTKTGKTCQSWNAQSPHNHTRTPKAYPNSGLILNYCRNPDNEDAPWCYTTDKNSRWEYCRIPACPDYPYILNKCWFIKDLGESYRGKVSKSKSGFTCQYWNSQYPHPHKEKGESNYCRNPGASKEGPWCYTTNSEIEWELCAIPECRTDDCYAPSESGGSYRGLVAITESGITCQHWDTQYPHLHDKIPSKHPYSGLEKNYCRNPDGKSRPWCYTTDSSKTWEYCPIQSCRNCTHTPRKYNFPVEDMTITMSGRTCKHWGDPVKQNFCRNPDNDTAPWCYTIDPAVSWEFCERPHCAGGKSFRRLGYPDECWDSRDRGLSYRGFVNTTSSGRICATWNSIGKENQNSPMNKPSSGLTGNYCRNPNSKTSPWCYTSVSGREWEYCSIPKCTRYCYNKADKGASYRGEVAVTKNGKNCQRWSSQIPHKHIYTPDNKPGLGFNGNYCRNPEGSGLEPWCYTTDADDRWGYCPVQVC